MLKVLRCKSKPFASEILARVATLVFERISLTFDLLTDLSPVMPIPDLYKNVPNGTLSSSETTA